MAKRIEELKLDGGWLCLDFINMVNDMQTDPHRDYVRTYDDLLRWLRHAKAYSSSQLQHLGKLAEKEVEESRELVSEILEIGCQLREVFLPLALGDLPGKKVQLMFNKLQGMMLSRMVMKFSSIDHIEFAEAHDLRLDAPKLRIMKSAWDLLLMGRANRIKQCGACDWLYLDLSKNGSRKWCNMQTCGSSVKAKKYYQKTKKLKHQAND